MRGKGALTVALIFSLAVLGASCYLGNRFLSTTAEERATLERGDALSAHLEQTLSTMKDIETGQRGYLLTGRQSYLQPYYQGLARIQQQLALLHAETAGQPEQAARLARAQIVISQKLVELDQTVRLEKAGRHQAALQVVITDAGRAYMDQIRSIFAQMQNEDRIRLQILGGPARSGYHTLYALIDGLPAVAAVLLILLYGLALRDSRRQRAAAERIRRNEQELQLIVDQVPGLISYLDRNLRYLRVNAEYERWLGRPANAIVGRSLSDVLGKAAYSRIEPELLKALAGEAHQSYEVLGIDGLGEKRFRISYSVDRDASGQVAGLVVLATDVSELWEAQERLRRLAFSLMRVQDEEQRRLARELHDSTAQHVAALALLLDRIHQAVESAAGMALSASSPASLSRMRADVQQAKDLSQQALLELRSVSYLLHPPLLDELGLGSALEWLVSGFQERSGIRVHLELPEELDRLAPEIELAAFRVAQESLSNVLRHSGASEVQIQVRIHGILEISVLDNGRGFSPGILQGATPGVGIAGMRERVEALGGAVQFASRGGVRVTASLPLRTQELAA